MITINEKLLSDYVFFFGDNLQGLNALKQDLERIYQDYEAGATLELLCDDLGIKTDAVEIKFPITFIDLDDDCIRIGQNFSLDFMNDLQVDAYNMICEHYGIFASTTCNTKQDTYEASIEEQDLER